MYTFNGALSATPLLAALNQDGGGGGGGSSCNSSSGSSNNNNNNSGTGNNCAGGNIPRTPEILNSLIAMTNPLEYSYPATTTQAATNSSASTNSNQVRQPLRIKLKIFAITCKITRNNLAKLYKFTLLQGRTKKPDPLTHVEFKRKKDFLDGHCCSLVELRGRRPTMQWGISFYTHSTKS